MLKKLYEKSELAFALAWIAAYIVHSVFNGLSVFANEAVMTPQRHIVSGILLAVIAGGYAVWLALMVGEEE